MQSELVRLEGGREVPHFSSTSPDVRLVVSENTQRRAHRIILARLSSLLHSIMADLEGEEDLCILIPDLSSQQMDRFLHLAYHGTMTGLSRADITTVTTICHLLQVRQEQLVVRAEEREEPKHKAEFEEFESEDMTSYDHNEDVPIIQENFGNQYSLEQIRLKQLSTSTYDNVG